MTAQEDLERSFHQAMVRIYEQARDESGYVATRFLQMVSERGGVVAARQLITGGASDGFTTPWEKQRLDLSVEFHVLLPQFTPLFNQEERELARRRLLDYGFDVDRALEAAAEEGG